MPNKSLNIAALQLPTLSMSGARIDYYLKILHDNDVKLALLGEYNLNSFFNELIKMPLSIIKEQISHKKELFYELSQKYSMTIVAPIVLEKDGELIKGCMKFSKEGKNGEFYPQNFLINYDHWNEDKFFANKNQFNFKIPSFELDGFKFGIIFGFETHFDVCWGEILKNNVDCVLVPTASTFDSSKRWEDLLCLRAFTNLVYVLRANRIGKIKLGENSFDFYGDSFLILPNGEISQRLKEKEEALIVSIDKKELASARKLWKFTDILKSRGIL